MRDRPQAPQVVILAGGLGTRLRALTGRTPKALVPVAGEPFAHHQLRLLADQGVRDVVYVIGYGGDEVREAIGDGSAFGLAVSYADEGERLHGTGGALRFALDAAVLDDVVAVLYGDSYLPIELGPVWTAFETSGRPALMTVFRNDDRWDPSNAVFDDGSIVVYDKRPECRDPLMAWIDYGLSVLRRDVIAAIPAGDVVDLGEVYSNLSSRGELAGFEVTTRFYEVGTPDGVADLERYLSRTR